MEMEDSTDFTFSLVGLQVDDDTFESPKTIPNGKDNIRGDSLSNGVGALKIDDMSRDSNSVNVILPPKFQVKESPTQKVVSDCIDSAEGSQEKKPGVKKTVARAKVPFEKGYSQMDWLKLTRMHPDLADLKGQSNRRFISMDEVRQHKTGDSSWTVLKGRVYNISPYMKFHPGGVDMLMKAAGKDGTSLFNKYHAWVNFEFLLEKCLVGVLEDSL